jgi:hypothetical protein
MVARGIGGANVILGLAMSIYNPIHDRLQRSNAASLKLSFVEIEHLIGRPLPQSAYDRAEWWSNEDLGTTKHVQCRAWQTAGYNAEVNLGDRTVTFWR